MRKRKDFGLFFWFHLLSISLYLGSPFLVSWKVVLTIVLLIQIQFLLLKGCYITKLEFGNASKYNYVYYYLVKIYPGISYGLVNFATNYGYHLLILAAAFFLQHFSITTPLLNNLLKI
jgi:hypothetical protein